RSTDLASAGLHGRVFGRLGSPVSTEGLPLRGAPHEGSAAPGRIALRRVRLAPARRGHEGTDPFIDTPNDHDARHRCRQNDPTCHPDFFLMQIGAAAWLSGKFELATSLIDDQLSKW